MPISYNTGRFTLWFLCLFFVFQVLFPLRHFLLTNNVLWTENGFRFSWNVMIMEKSGSIRFKVLDNNTKQYWIEYPSKRLSKIQETQMSFQPDMIWQYGQYLENIYRKKGIDSISIYVDSKVALNNKPSLVFIDEKVDIAKLDNIDAIYDFVISIKK